MNDSLQKRWSESAAAFPNKVVAAWRRWRIRYPRWCTYLPPSIAPETVTMTAIVLAALIAFAAGAGVIRLFACQAAKAELVQLQQQESSLKQKYVRRLPEMPQIGLLQAEKLRIEQKRALLRQQLTGNGEQEALMEEIDAAGRARGLHFTMFKPGLRQKAAIEIGAVGSYRAMARFIDDLAALPRLVLLDPLILQASADDNHGAGDRNTAGSRLTLQATAIALQPDPPHDEHDKHDERNEASD
jgi:Tfp pilus assembly protein PilO